jgi:hypothetical protein
LSLVLSAAGCVVGLARAGWAPDELGPTEVLRQQRHISRTAGGSKYPPFHYYVLAVATAPLAVVRFTGCCVTSAPVVER